ncbi:MAG: DUF4190 domain-containing protein, partial [Trebonia sp.]
LIADLPAGPLAGAPLYPHPWYPPRPLARADTNSTAGAALACGVGGFYTMGLTAVPAIVLGHSARRQVRRTGQRGAGMALAGMILGWTGIALLAAAVAALVIIAGHSAQPAVDLPVVIKPVPAHPVLPVIIRPAHHPVVKPA